MHWQKIESLDNLIELNALSHKGRVFVFKFTPDRPIDVIVNLLLEREWNRDLMNMSIYKFNPVENKLISDKIAELYNIMPHSPQCLIIENGKCIYSQSNGKIRFSELKHFANSLINVT